MMYTQPSYNTWKPICNYRENSNKSSNSTEVDKRIMYIISKGNIFPVKKGGGNLMDCVWSLRGLHPLQVRLGETPSKKISTVKSHCQYNRVHREESKTGE